MFYEVRKTQSKPRTSDVRISVVDADSLTAASQAHGKHVAVLNFANNNSPGGGYYKSGQRGNTQEDSLIWDTDILGQLDGERYPICKTPEDACVFVTTDVTITKTERRITILSCPAIAGPRVRDDLRDIDISYFVHDSDRANTEARIKLICKVASRMNVNTLVLGAWGCGVFCNPVYEICQIWRRYIEKYEIPDVIFAIPKGYLHNMFVRFLETTGA